MVNQILTQNKILKMCAACLGLFLLFVVLISDVHAEYTGNDSDYKSITRYIKRHVNSYFKDINKIKSASRRRDMVDLRSELERLSLKIDAGDIKSDTFRQKVITIRRNALKKRNTNQFIVHNFDRLNNNRLGGGIETLFTGKKPSISPWLALSLVNEEKRLGKKMLHIDYDVQEGEAAFELPVKQNHFLSRYNALSFKVKGDSKAIVLSLEHDGGDTISTVVTDITKEWRTISIPFYTMDNFKVFDYNKVSTIRFTLKRTIAGNEKGVLCIDEIALKKVVDETNSAEKRIFTYEVEGAVPIGTNKSFLRTN